MFYYFDDDGNGLNDDPWQQKEFDNDEQALAWGEQLALANKSKQGVVYDENFRILKEFYPA